MDQLSDDGLLTLKQIIGDQQHGFPPIIPVKKSCWWQGVKSGRFPKPLKIGNGRGSFWRARDIKKIVDGAA